MFWHVGKEEKKKREGKYIMLSESEIWNEAAELCRAGSGVACHFVRGESKWSSLREREAGPWHLLVAPLLLMQRYETGPSFWGYLRSDKSGAFPARLDDLRSCLTWLLILSHKSQVHPSNPQPRPHPHQRLTRITFHGFHGPVVCSKPKVCQHTKQTNDKQIKLINK